MRPVILIGNGADCPELPKVLELGVPVLTSWQAIDLLENEHPNNFGRPGIYGQRCANSILANADQVISIGCRCSVWTVGYTFNPPVHVMVDTDPAETARYPNANVHNETAAEFINAQVPYPQDVGERWLEACNLARETMPWVEGPDMTGTYINPYHFIDRLSKFFKSDQIITTDTGTPYVVAHQVLKIRRPQRLIASGGLSEMGAGLPGAIGAAIGSSKEVVMMSGDGGFMMNIQELATVRTMNLPIKMIVFNNGGYNMIKRTQENMGMQIRGTGEPDISMPDFRRIANSFDMMGCQVRTWEDFNRVVPGFMGYEHGPALLEVFTSPNQKLLKLNPSKNPDGTINSPEFWDLTFK